MPYPHNPKAVSTSSAALNRPGLLFCCHLHHDNTRRRDCNPMSPTPLRLPRLSGKGRAWDVGILAAVAGAQQMSFSAEKGESRKRGGKPKEQTMDEETRKSIGQGDEKTKKSMQTVKVGHCTAPHQG